MFKLLNIIEFSSDRKRMTVVVRCPNGEIKVMCKGADSVLFPRLLSQEGVPFTKKCLDEFANQGLRTLLLAEKTITEDEYENWHSQYHEAQLSIINRQEEVD